MDPDKNRPMAGIESRGPYIKVEAVLILWLNNIQGIEDSRGRRDLGCNL
jgi:hypothetical protein